ncbi:MAG: YggS family pyridoxal phosphate-dependent enzyme [Bacillota bacterium]|nr:YggS family pyridoxal phosphate-dependent enzyme [Bacillota bacterium]
MDPLEERIKQVRGKIEKAAKRAGRNAEEITLVAVTKTVPDEAIARAAGYGIEHMGENRVQELLQKIVYNNVIKWHFIGHLQTNKVKYIIGKVFLIHSLDRLELAEEIQDRSNKAGLVTPVLIQVNIAGEKTKSGICEASVLGLAEAVSQMPNISLQGLMTIPPWCEDPEEARAYFRRLREIRDEIAARKLKNADMKHLSMGMSGDFETAIEEGATIVRIGTAIFGSRSSKA